MTLSVGCRAPSAAELITRLSETILLEPRSIIETLQHRYTEDDNVDEYIVYSSSSSSGACSNYLSPKIKMKMKSLILKAVEDALDDDENIFDPLVGRIVTEPNRCSETSYPVPLGAMGEEWREEMGVWGDATSAIEEVFTNGNGCLRRAEGIAFAWSSIPGEDKPKKRKFRMYAHGREPIELITKDDQNLFITIGRLMDRIASGPPLDQRFVVQHLGIDLNTEPGDSIYEFISELVEEGLLYGDER
jgi:hypothetical protein